MKAGKKIRREAVYRLTYCLFGVFSTVPRTLAIYLGGWLGLATWKLLSRERYRCFRHLSLVYGDELSLREKTRIGRSFFVNTGRNLADVFRFRKHFADEISPLISAEGMEYFDAAYRRGKGVIGVTGHIGNFELLAAYVQGLGHEVAVIGRELYHPGLNRLLVENREAVGLTNITTTESPKRALEWLRKGRVLGVLIDTDSSRVRGMFVPMFGRWSNTPVGQTVLGLRAGAAFLPIACLRTENNRYRVIIRPPVEVERSGDFEADVYNVTLKCTRALEKIIGDHRDQWIWLHNRWRTQRQHPPLTQRNKSTS